MILDLARRLRRLSAKLGFDRDWYLIVVAAVIGLVMALAAIAFILPLRLAEQWAEGAGRGMLIWLIPAAPLIGALLTGGVYWLLRDDGNGSGVSRVMYAIHRSKSRLAPVIGVRKWIASTLTIGSGGSAGAEGPIVTIGSVIGSNVGRALNTNPQGTATLLGCGAAAGIASVFNAPFAGIFFVMEILLRDFSLRTFTPIVIAAVISAATTQAILGADAIFATAEDFHIDAFTAAEIPNYLLLGVVCGLAAALFIVALDSSEKIFGRLPVHPNLRPAVGGLLLGVMGIAFILIIQPHHTVPAFYGNGYPVIQELLNPAHYYNPEGLRPMNDLLVFLILLGLLKAIGTCLTIGSGGAGGIFAPSLLMGAAIGGAFGYVVNSLGWFPAASPAHYAMVGMAAMVAATIHAPLTAILMVYEITRSYEIILPLMLAAVISTIVARLVFRDSVYTVKLTRLGVRVGALSDLTMLRRLSVRDVPLMRAVTVQHDDSAQRLLDLCESGDESDFIVLDEQGEYAGVVTAEDLRSALVYREAIPLLQVHEIMRSDVPTVSMDETLDLVLEMFSRHDAQSLPVLDENGGDEKPRAGPIAGLITRSRLLAKYQSVLSRA